jgi:hypothetical protein
LRGSVHYSLVSSPPIPNTRKIFLTRLTSQAT